MTRRRAALSREFAEAYRANVEFVWRVLARRGVPDEQLEDATQEVFVVMHRRWGAWGSDSPRAWLFGVAKRVAGTQHRAQQRRARKLAALPAPAEPARLDQRLEDRARLDALARAVDSLDPERHAVFTLIEIEQLSAPEAAVALGCKLNTVYSRLRRARASIVRAMAEFDAEGRVPDLPEELHGTAR
jgi:RNA polymerase sigma-70 factor (ECF subfamily)